MAGRDGGTGGPVTRRRYTDAQGAREPSQQSDPPGAASAGPESERVREDPIGHGAYVPGEDEASGHAPRR